MSPGDNPSARLSRTRAIPPALSDVEWSDIDGDPRSWLLAYCVAAAGRIDGAKVMALANAALPDGDPRKITHEKIVALREVLSASDYMAPSNEIGPAANAKRQRETDDRWRLASELLDAIESLLPPDVTTYTSVSRPG